MDPDSRRARPSLFGQVIVAWMDLRGSTRRLLDAELREGTLLAMAVASSLLWCLGRIATIWLSPAAARLPAEALIGQVQGELVSALFFRTLALYGVAALAGLIARWAGGTGSWKDSRTATFWAALVAAPVILSSVLSAALVAPVSPEAAAGTRVLGELSFVLAFAFALAEAHGFRSALKVLLVVAALGAIPPMLLVLLT